MADVLGCGLAAPVRPAQVIFQHVTGLVYGKEERTVEPLLHTEKFPAKVRADSTEAGSPPGGHQLAYLWHEARGTGRSH